MKDNDRFRSFIKKFIKTKSYIYSAGSKLLDLAYVTWREGIRTWYTLAHSQRSTVPGNSLTKIDLKRLEHPFFLRPGTRDSYNLISNTIREEYGKFKVPIDPHWMIDAGAYTGDVTAYFLSRYPNMRVVALEPNKANFDVAKKNLFPYGSRCYLLDKALWGSDIRLQLKDALEMSSVEQPSDAASDYYVEGVSVASIMKEYQIPHIDILKMDIEGAESDVFSAPYEDWLVNTSLIIMELHGKEAQSVVQRAMARCEFEMVKYRSVVYCYSHTSLPVD